jgi:hypothetical protein
MQVHQSRFKAYLLSPKQLVEERKSIQVFNIWLKEQSLQLSSAEQVMLFVFMFLELRKTQAWAMSSGRKSQHEAGRGGLRIQSLFGPFEFLKQFKSCEYLLDILVEYRPRSLPQAVFEVLWRWEREDYDLILMERAPSPQEMLAQQARGRRVVTLSWADALQGTLVDGKRDAFEFLLHDLVHADLFFKEEQSFLAQKFFFSDLEEIIQSEKLLVEGDELFLQGLSYLMSDMNSHIAHLEAHWRALLIQWQLRKEDKSPRDTLSEQGVSWVDSLVRRVSQSSSPAVKSIEL